MSLFPDCDDVYLIPGFYVMSVKDGVLGLRPLTDCEIVMPTLREIIETQHGFQ